MLDKWDIEFIRRNRHDIMRNRTVTVEAIILDESGKHPVTGQPYTEEVSIGEFEVIWRVPQTKHMDRLQHQGYDVETTDRFVKFHVDEDIAHYMDELKYVVRNNIRYTIITIDPRGIGRHPNRYEFLVRRVR